MGLEKRECQEKREAERSLLPLTRLKKAIQAQHTQLLTGGKNIILVTLFLCRAAEQTPRSAAATSGHNGALKSKSGGTERKLCVPPGQRRH